jgi:hypothetical protein
MEILGLVGFVFSVTVAGALIRERRMDVLNGPYVQGRIQLCMAGSRWNPLRSLADRFNWNARGAIYLTSLA